MKEFSSMEQYVKGFQRFSHAGKGVRPVTSCKFLASISINFLSHPFPE